MKKNQVSKEQLEDFFRETDNKKIKPEEKEVNEVRPSIQQIYYCPKCHSKLNNRYEGCPYCHYKGYIPMSEAETKRIRTILFFILMVIAIAVIIFRSI